MRRFMWFQLRLLAKNSTNKMNRAPTANALQRPTSGQPFPRSVEAVSRLACADRTTSLTFCLCPHLMPVLSSPPVRPAVDLKRVSFAEFHGIKSHSINRASRKTDIMYPSYLWSLGTLIGRKPTFTYTSHGDPQILDGYDAAQSAKRTLPTTLVR